jgi:4-hydroxy 2-oxovalerate aldolase
MNKIQILDCTLRDGGYINNWEFGNKNILKVIEKLISSNIEIIECGFLDSNIDKEQDTTRFKNIGILNNLLQNINPNSNQSLVAMIEYTKYDLNSLAKVTEDSKITGIRFSFRKSDYKIALEEMKIILEKGYKLFVQPISTDSYSKEELDYLIKKTNSLNPYALYIVDTQGSIFPENFKILFDSFNSKMDSNIKLGFHSHNNMQLSYAIAIEFINLAKNKEIIIDSSIYGMGRGAGNLNTELLADYLNKKYNKDYKIENILELIDSYFNALHKNFGWGYSLAHFLSASNETHPNYASYLLDTKRLSINEIKILLEKIPDNEKYDFDKLLIENILTIQNIIAGINDYYGDEQMIETKRYQKVHSIYTSLTGSSTLIERSNKEDCLSILKQFINDKELYDENKGTDYNLIDISMIMSDIRALNHSKIVFH